MLSTTGYRCYPRQPLSVTGARDRVIWAENKNGRFTIKSAYRLAQEEQWDNVMVEGSNQSPMKQTWKRLWQMNVPNKVRHFAWKAYKKILSMKENLRRRNITKDSTCDVCGKQVVTISHLFWSVTMQKRCGPHANSPSRLKSNHRGSIWT